MTNTDNNELICYCIEVDKQTIINSIKVGNTTLQTIKNDTKACTGNKCKDKNPNKRCCSKEIKELIELYTNQQDNTNCSCCNTK
ncbi:MAG: (2Fe-2S)-binding protein [Epsilonproteobacteria bacterium]|nr:(2Fe-2S)-binding protein [Campylobacterota bacterium]